MYYKIIKNNVVIDVNNVFLRIQRKHNILINTDLKYAEYICSSDGSQLYITSWTIEVNDPKRQAELVEAILIDEDEYNTLREQLSLNVVVEVIDSPQEDIIIIEPSEPERKLETLSLINLAHRVEQLEKQIEELLNK